MRHMLQRFRVWIAAGSAVGIVVVLLAVWGGLYLFGGSGGAGKTTGGATSAPTLVASANTTLLTIDSSSSTASFTIHEVLFGSPNTVVGKTSSVTGQLLLDSANPSQSKVGEIRVDLSTLVTDSDLRNRTIQSRILESDQAANQYAVFIPASLKGLPTSAATTGQTLSFQITGALTIHQVTRTVTFTAQATLTNATTLTGQAQTTVNYADYNIAIPSVPSVTDVTNSVVLAISFTAHSA